MNRRMPVFVGFLLLIVLSVMAGSRGVVQMVGADAAGDTFTYLPIMVKHNPPAYKIIFASDRDNARGVYDIFMMDTDGANVKNLTNTPLVSETYPTWSPDGAQIAYLSGTENAADVFVMSSTGEQKLKVSGTPTAQARGVVWSPDSTRLGFVSDRDDVAGVHDVFVVNRDGAGLVNLTNSTDIDERSLDWSPDSSRIVYLADLSVNPISLLGHILTMNANGTNKVTISTNNGFNLDPIWSPQGDKIAFIIPGFSDSALVTVNPDGTNRIFVTNPNVIKFVEEGISWDTSGSQILFKGSEASSGGTVNLFVVNATTGDYVNVTANVPGFGYPFRSMSLSATDTQIVYDEDFLLQRGDISIINVDGTGYTNLTSSDNDDDRWPNWSPIMLP
ncbi:MAG: PD40 domain-containing protein [Chloroflexi bacterium]|nr:PD40 domain-containing protein [Chloroflexota bacterium]